jgi:hypothetical protein
MHKSGSRQHPAGQGAADPCVSVNVRRRGRVEPLDDRVKLRRGRADGTRQMAGRNIVIMRFLAINLPAGDV